jgi:protein ImuB
VQGGPSLDKAPRNAFNPGSAALPLHRPAWLLPEPLPLSERGELPWLEGRPLQLVSGPERIEAGWWDGAPTARDYFIAQAEDGSLVWLWRGRLPAMPGAVQWFLQGRFA